MDLNISMHPPNSWTLRQQLPWQIGVATSGLEHFGPMLGGALSHDRGPHRDSKGRIGGSICRRNKTSTGLLIGWVGGKCKGYTRWVA